MASLNGALSFKQAPSLSHATNKTANLGSARQLALEGRKHGIRANSVPPGLIVSGATRDQLEDDSFGRQMRDRTRLGRLGQPEDVANAGAFLVSDKSLLRDRVDLVVGGGMKVW